MKVYLFFQSCHRTTKISFLIMYKVLKCSFEPTLMYFLFCWENRWSHYMKHGDINGKYIRRKQSLYSSSNLESQFVMSNFNLQQSLNSL